jgi:glycogen debranching enzyme
MDRVAAPLNAGAPVSGRDDRTVVTLVNGTTFCLSTATGEIVPGEAQGLFFRDARVLSRWEMRLDGHHPQQLSVDVHGAEQARFVLRRRPATGHADSTLLLVRDRRVDSGLVENIRIDNMGRESTSCELRITFDADFADLFAVKEGRTGTEGTTAMVTLMDVTMHSAADPTRGLRITATGEPELSPTTLTWHVVVPSRESWEASVLVQPIIGDHRVDVRTTESRTHHVPWRDRATAIAIGDPAVAATIRRSTVDLDALRMKDADGKAFFAAGAPWFMTLFGRDSLLTAWMCLPLDVSLAVGTLELLSGMQGRRTDPITEEQPGRILHEIRLGPDNTSAIGGRQYYGTVDATPLFVMLVAEAWRWGADPETIRGLLPAVDAALEWMATDGDPDGDGFLEYRRATDRGLVNQGWKDSFDGVNDASGGLAEPPIALCEVQGYAYAALLGRAELAEAFGDDATADDCRNRAKELRAAFADAFWMPEHGSYAIALDRQHRQVDALASNAAHCLWTGIATDEHAARLVTTLSDASMNSGYGLRTLSSRMGAYNPMSYHNGSVWPHDTAIAVAGLIRYAHLPGAVELAQRLARGLFDAASAFSNRLPELFCGFARADFAPPIPYPTSCSPQAWASAAPLLVLRSLLGLAPDAPHRQIKVAARLPVGWGEVRLDGLRIGETVTRVRACGDDIDVEGVPEDWAVVRS